MKIGMVGETMGVAHVEQYGVGTTGTGVTLVVQVLQAVMVVVTSG